MTLYHTQHDVDPEPVLFGTGPTPRVCLPLASNTDRHSSSPAPTTTSSNLDDGPLPQKERQLSEARNRATTLEAQRRSAEQRLLDLNRDIGTKAGHLEELRRSASNVAKELENLRKDRAAANVHCQRLHADYRAAMKDIERLEEDMAKSVRRQGWKA